MARKRISMKKMREVIRLKMSNDFSERQIARALNISRPVVAKYWREFQASGLTFEQLETMSDSKLLQMLEKRPGVQKQKCDRYKRLVKYFPYFLKEMKRKGVTLNLLWQEYKQKYPDGYQYAQFCYHFQVWRGASEVRMHIKHKAGDKMFVDYAGAKLAVTDPKSGEKTPMEVFVAILGASDFTYVEATPSQEKEEWIRSNERAFWYFGGVSSAIVPDNLRSAVSRSNRYEPEINPTFDDFAEHYGTVIIPTRVREARDKALVENAVRLVYQRIYAPLRNRVFYSLEELNEAIWELLEEHNNKNFQRLKFSRRELFEQIEKSALKPLPKERYPMKNTKWLTVGINYHVELRDDRHYYSVPYYLRKKGGETKVKMIYDERIVAIYYDNVRIAQYKRDRRPNEYTTLPEHMPPEHRFYAEWSPQRFCSWAKSIGGETLQVIEKVLQSRKHPEQAFKVCLGILNLAKKYGAQRLNKACGKANRFGTYSYKRIESMLKLGVEEEGQQGLEFVSSIPAHENIRGSHYYN
ncbi:MAG: IS21 family transposase [Spirochaetes bacterium]|nr:MAG: IS21 family transposase [Spirochaetota bacterium]